MAGTALVRIALTACLVIDLTPFSQSLDTNNSTKSKRQIFREQVNPQAGGRIPEDAFRSDRLALNRLNKEGIAVPDGVVLEARHRESHYGSHRHDPDIQASIVKVVLGSDGRYAPPEGRYPFNSLVESTYVLRPPINTPVIAVPPRRPHLATLRLPARPFFQQDHSAFNSLDQHIDFFNAFDPNFPANGLWTGLLGPVPDVPNRLLRRQAKIPKEDVVAQNSNLASRVAGKPSHSEHGRDQTPRLTPEGRNLQLEDVSFFPQGRNFQSFQHPPVYSSPNQQSHETHNSVINTHPTSERSNGDYENRLVPVYLTPHKEQNGGLKTGQNYISYIPPSPNYNIQHALPFNNAPHTPNPDYYYQPYQPIDPGTGQAIEKTVESRPHYVFDSPGRDDLNGQNEKQLIPILHQHNSNLEDDNQFHSVVQNPHVTSALLDHQEHPRNQYEEISKPDQSFAALEDSFPTPTVPFAPNYNPTHQQLNVLVPVAVTHNRQSPQDYNHLKESNHAEPNSKLKGSEENQNIRYQLVNSFSNLNVNYHNHKSPHSNDYNQFRLNNKNDHRKEEHSSQNPRYQHGEEPPVSINYQNSHPISPPRSETSGKVSGSTNQPDERWQQPPSNSLRIIGQESSGYESGNRGVQYVRGGLHLEVVNDQLDVRQQSRGEVGQKKASSELNPNQGSTNDRGSSTSNVGSNHLNQVLHYIEPHEVVHQISTAPSIENEYPSLETVPETSFMCPGSAPSMLPDPETSCQVFHLCSSDGSKESFLCPKGSRYDSQKLQCAPWTEVTCHA